MSLLLPPLRVSAPPPVRSVTEPRVKAEASIALTPEPPDSSARSIPERVSDSEPLRSEVFVRRISASRDSISVSMPPPPMIASEPLPPVKKSSPVVPMRRSSPPAPSSRTEAAVTVKPLASRRFAEAPPVRSADSIAIRASDWPPMRRTLLERMMSASRTSTTVSRPTPPSSVSVPVPPESRSSPPPPKSESSPLPPESVSLPAPP